MVYRSLGGSHLLIFIACYLFLIGGLVYRVYWLIKHKLSGRNYIYQLLTIFIILILITVKPRGLFNYEKLEDKDVFTAESEGAANCTSKLKLKSNGQFSIEDICFGFYKTRGIYTVKNDTINFKFSSADDGKNYKFGIFNPIQREIFLYKSANDTLPCAMSVLRNELVEARIKNLPI